MSQSNEKDQKRLADDPILWEHVCAVLAHIAQANMPGWDAGEMTTAALREVDDYLLRYPPGSEAD